MNDVFNHFVFSLKMVATILVSKSIKVTHSDLSLSFKHCSHFSSLIHGKLGGELVNEQVTRGHNIAADG